MYVKHDDLRCCLDCVQLLANGDDAGGVAERIAAYWYDPEDANNLVLACKENCDDCDEFAAGPCQVCGSHLAGEFHRAVVLAPGRDPMEQEE